MLRPHLLLFLSVLLTLLACGEEANSPVPAATPRATAAPTPTPTPAPASYPDGDNIIDAEDNCPYVRNYQQGDLDKDGIGDFCDFHYDQVAAAPVPASEYTGHRRLLVVNYHYPEDVPRSDVADAVALVEGAEGPLKSLRQYWQEMSQGALDVTATYMDWRPLSQTREELLAGPPEQFIQRVETLIRRDVEAQYGIEGFDTLMARVQLSDPDQSDPGRPDRVGCYAYLPPGRGFRSGSLLGVGRGLMVVDAESCDDWGTVFHEFGHTLGLLHSSEVACYDPEDVGASQSEVPPSLLAPTAHSPGCRFFDYGFGLMGYYQGWIQLQHRYEAGWTRPGEIVMLEGSGRHTQLLASINAFDGGVRGAVVSLGRGFAGRPLRYWVTFVPYRGPSLVPDDTYEGHPQVNVTAEVYRPFGPANRPHDTSALRFRAHHGDHRSHGGALDAGEVFWDSHKGVRVTVEAIDAEREEAAVVIEIAALRENDGVATTYRQAGTQVITWVNHGAAPLALSNLRIEDPEGTFTLVTHNCDVLVEGGSCAAHVHANGLAPEKPLRRALLHADTTDEIRPDLTHELVLDPQTGSKSRVVMR